ncbi:MAG: MBL fold metallo-hydrolase [Candidatus Saganbacteria bacterium]|nr:MBL fold metallo-hydrolase [Candidatus Saganbacteria bacterium]
MQIKTVKVGSLQTNCYIVIDDKSREAIVIDPGDEAQKIVAAIKGLKVKYIVITHGHPDHFGAIDQVKKTTGAAILMNPADAWFFKPDQEIAEGDQIKFGDIVLEVLQTPGHSEGGVCLYTPGYLFAGDTLFSTAHGRVDLPGGSMKKMLNSLKRLGALPPNTQVFPGHDESTTIALEKERGTLG